MPSLLWYWNRFGAMEPGELPRHIRRQVWQVRNSVLRQNWSNLRFERPRPFPVLPEPSAAPENLRKTLRDDAERILLGRWRMFGGLELQVDDPPRWHRDYLAGIDAATTTPAHRLNHRDLKSGADIRMIWEFSRWHQLLRLAQ